MATCSGAPTKKGTNPMAVTSVAETREQRGLRIWRERGDEIRPMSSGGLSVPSESGERTYRVSLMDHRCGCPDHERRGETCKHLFAATVWAAHERTKRARRAERVAA